MKKIVVSKFGNEPNLFGNDLRHGMLGEWECLKLLKVLSEDKDNLVFYYGKAIWNEKKAAEYFKRPSVTYIDSSENKSINTYLTKDIDEFHIVLGPHAFYNGAKGYPSWESIKESLVTERLLERVKPQIDLININPKAKCFFYLSDRRFLLQAADLKNNNSLVLGQNLVSHCYDRVVFDKDYSRYNLETKTCLPFRFETLWLYEKDREKAVDYSFNRDNKVRGQLIIPANQVTSDDEIENSRLDKINDFTEFYRDFVVCGKWTNKNAIDRIKEWSNFDQYLYGLSQENYYDMLKTSDYALVLFNTKDSPKMFVDNWLTVKYWECVYHGCITFVETNKPISFIPEELQVKNGRELSDKILRAECNKDYKTYLINLQLMLLKSEYFDGTYFNNNLKEWRTKYV